MIRIKELSHSHASKVVFENLDLEVASGHLVGLSGPSGCGKTTLLRLIAGLDKAGSGQIWLDNQLANDPKILIPPQRRQVALVFQDLALWPHMSAFAHLEFVLSAKAEIQNSKFKIQNRIAQLLAIVKFPPHLTTHFPHQLSGGERQRLALARALAQEPKILLLDEPLGNLDQQLKKEVRGQIINLHREQKLTTLWVSHDRSDFVSGFNRVVNFLDLVRVE